MPTEPHIKPSIPFSSTKMKNPFSSIPQDFHGLVQSLSSSCTTEERDRAIAQYNRISTWEEPLMPLIFNLLLANQKGETLIQQLKETGVIMDESQKELISTIDRRNEFIRSESKAVDESLKRANDEYSRKLVSLSDRVDRSIELISKNQNRLIMMYQQITVRNRESRLGKLKRFGIGIVIGLVIAKFLF